MSINEIEKARKFKVFSLSALFGLGTLLAFLIFNLHNRVYDLALMDLVLILIVILWYAGLKKLHSHTFVYRLGLLAMTSIFLYIIAAGESEHNILYSMYIFPMSMFFFLNKREGIIWSFSFMALLSLFLFQPFPLGTQQYDRLEATYFLLPLIFTTVLGYLLEASRSQFSEMFLAEQGKLLKEKQRLEKAMEEVKTLSGMLPICSSCKKIRDDEGYWGRLEEYMSKHSDVKFSHGLCPECLEKLYPELKVAQASRQARKEANLAD